MYKVPDEVEDPNPRPTNMKKHIIRIGFKDKPKSFQSVPRDKLHISHINKIFNCNCELLLDDFSEAYYPEQWVWELKAKPFKYTIVEYLKTELPIDPEEDPNFMGKSQLFVENVPDYVDKVSLTAWLTAGMRSNVTRIKKLRERVADAKKKLKQVEQQLKDVPFMAVDAVTEKESQQQRKQMAEFLVQEIEIWEGKLKERKDKLAEVEKEFGSMDFTLEKYENSEASNEWTWKLVLPKEKRKLATKIVRMDDWPNYNLALRDKGGVGGDPPPLPPSVVYGRLAEHDPEYEARGLLANMRRTRIIRHMHGRGGLVQEDLVRVTPNYFYRGDWVHGKKHGRGKCTRYNFVYEGGYENDRRYTPDDAPEKANFTFSNGDIYNGPASLKPQATPALFKGIEYGHSLWHGKQGTYHFADGSVYVGDMINGIPTGKGKYTDVNGDVMEGEFVHGMLHGYGRHEKGDGIVYEGEFWKGLAHGKAKVTLPNGGFYEGDFYNGVLHGRVTGHYDQEKNTSGSEKGEVDAWRFKGEEVENAKQNEYVSPGSPKLLSDKIKKKQRLANRGNGKDRRSVVSRKLYNDGKSSGSWSFEGYFRDGYRQGHGCEKYGEKIKVGGDRESLNFHWLEEMAGVYKQGRIQGLGLYTRGPKGSVLWPVSYYTHKHRSELDPVVYEEQYHRAVATEKMFIASKREALKLFRKHREVVKKIEKRNKAYYVKAVQEQRAEFFDEDIWELMTEEERAEETRFRREQEARKTTSEMRVMLRKK